MQTPPRPLSPLDFGDLDVTVIELPAGRGGTVGLRGVSRRSGVEGASLDLTIKGHINYIDLTV